MRLRWRKLPEPPDGDWRKRDEIVHGGTPLMTIAIAVINREAGFSRIGSHEGVEASARRNGEIIYLRVGEYFCQLPGATPHQEVLTSLIRRLAKVVPTEEWGVKVTCRIIDVPDGVFSHT